MNLRIITHAALFLRVLTFAAALPYFLRLRISTVARLLEPGTNPSAVPEEKVRRIISYVEIAIRSGKPLVRSGCLTRGLTRYYFLRRAGLDVTLCFGMGRHDTDVLAHCWLVRNGKPFLEVEDPRPLYVEMYRISRDGGRAPAFANVCQSPTLSNP